MWYSPIVAETSPIRFNELSHTSVQQIIGCWTATAIVFVKVCALGSAQARTASLRCPYPAALPESGSAQLRRRQIDLSHFVESARLSAAQSLRPCDPFLP
jgi:hypothetical protein